MESSFLPRPLPPPPRDRKGPLLNVLNILWTEPVSTETVSHCIPFLLAQQSECTVECCERLRCSRNVCVTGAPPAHTRLATQSRLWDRSRDVPKQPLHSHTASMAHVFARHLLRLPHCGTSRWSRYQLPILTWAWPLPLSFVPTPN